MNLAIRSQKRPQNTPPPPLEPLCSPRPIPGFRSRREWRSRRVRPRGPPGSVERNRREAALRRLGHGYTHRRCRDGSRAGGGNGRNGRRPQRPGAPRPYPARTPKTNDMRTQKHRTYFVVTQLFGDVIVYVTHSSLLHCRFEGVAASSTQPRHMTWASRHAPSPRRR